MGDDTVPSRKHPVIPKLPARFRIVGQLGSGGMGAVFRAHDATLGRDVAIKVMRRIDGVTVDRFVREARAAARLQHPNIVAIHDVDPEGGWMVMAVVDGTSLDAVPRPLAPELVRGIAEQMLSALAAAHAAGVIHRDIKPSNVLIRDGTGGLHVTIVDFGIARVLDDATISGALVGTPAYMAPEQLDGAAIDGRADLYALGGMLFELLVGERAPRAWPSPIAIQRLAARCRSQPGLAHLIERCLRIDPNERFASAEAALVELRDDRPLPAQPSKLRRYAVTIGVAAVIAAVPPLLVLALRGGGGSRDARIDQAFTLAQRGEHERAAQILDDYLGEHPDDPDALSLRVLTGWWGDTDISKLLERANAAALSKGQRAMLRGIALTQESREDEAAAYLAAADRELPDTPEIVYLLGEAQFHSQHIDEGVATLERAFHLDPRWEVALHHVTERRLMLGQAWAVRPLAAQLRPVDRSAAATLDCRIAIAEHDLSRAIEGAHAAQTDDDTAELAICLAQALTLSGDLDGAARAAQHAFELWPIDLREWGGFAHHAEQLLYRGKLDDYLALVRNKPSRQRTLALALWQPDAPLAEPPPRDDNVRTLTPLGAAIWILARKLEGVDAAATYNRHPEPEVKYFGQGLWAEARGDHATAIARYRAGLAVPSNGDLDMLLSHHLARVLVAAGDRTGAARACERVIVPRVYRPYRAIVLPDCIAWSNDAALDNQLRRAWSASTLAHPAISIVRAR